MHEAFEYILSIPFLEPLRAEFMRRALIGVMLIAPACALLGVQVVNARLAFFSDAVSHGVFAGVAMGWLLGMDTQLSLGLFAVLFGIAIVGLGRYAGFSEDTATGVVLSVVIAGGLALISLVPDAGRQVRTFIMGDVLTLDGSDMVRSALLLLAVLAFFLWGGNRLTLTGLNPELARTHGVSAIFYEYGFAALLALAVALAARIVGVLLVTALLVVPAATARNMARSWGGMCGWSLFLGWLGGTAGVLFSARPWAENMPTGAIIILAMSSLFCASLLFSRARRM